MGYMGFSMLKEVYQRKPKTSFSKMKKIYGDHLEEFHKSKGSGREWSEKEDFRNYVSTKIKNDNATETVVDLIVFIGIALIIALAIRFAWG